MFGIKRKGREQSARVYELLKERLVPVFQVLSGKLRYSGRRRLFIRWGRNNPRKAVSYYACFVVAILGWNVSYITGASGHETAADTDDPLKLREMTVMGDMFDGMMKINKNREAIHASISDYANAGISLTMKLDSLLNIDIKTGEDSLEIVRIIETLNIKENQHP